MKAPYKKTVHRTLGYQRLEPRLVLDASMLRITEFVASNDNSLADFEGDSPDWIELYNPSASAVDLSGLYLTDEADELDKWSFPNGSQIEAGGYLVVFASDKDTVMPNGEIHTSFRLSAGGEYLGLIDSNGSTVIDAYAPEFPPQEEDVSYGLAMQSTGIQTKLVAEGDQGRAWRPSSSVFDTTWTDPGFNDAVFNIRGATGFGYEASPGGQIDYDSEIETTVPFGTTSLYLRTPFQLTSLSGIDELALRMKYDDGFVAYLNGVEIASANADESTQWNSTASAIHDDQDAVQFQDFDASAAISALVVGENVLAIHGLNVSSSSSDFLIVPELVGVRYQIVSPDAVGFFDEPTPGYGNRESFAGFAAEPVFSVPHGFYTSPQQVAIASATPSAVIVYTTDGSMPTVNANLLPTNGTIYTGPVTVASTQSIRAITFKQDFKPSFVKASSYVFLDDVLDQSPQGQTPPGFAPDGTNGRNLDYGIDPQIINLYGEQAVKDSLLSLPTITLTTDTANLFDPSFGIYVNAENRGRNWERETSVELIHPDGTPGFSVNAGLRIRGGFSRNDFNPKSAFRLYFRGEYGDTKLRYPLFGDDGVDEFDVLDLRTPQNYSWSSAGDTQNTYLREVFARDTQADLGQPHTRSDYYHLYLDGQYWGVYQTQERVQKFYGESYLGGDEDEYDVVKSDLAVSGGTEIADGNDEAWRQLFDLAQALADDPSGNRDNYWTMQGLNPDGTRNESLPVLLDAENLVDYMLTIFYTGGYDTGLSQFLGNERANNWFGIRNRVSGDRGFQFFMHDNEHSLGAANPTHGSANIDRTGPFFSANDRVFEQFNPQFLHQDLLGHPEYRQLFIDRVQAAMLNDGPLTPENSIARLLARKDQVDPAIIAHSARWGDAVFSNNPRTKATWQNEVDWLVNSYFPVRGSRVLSQLRVDGLFTSFSAPVFSQFGGEVSTGYHLELTAGAGTIYYTTDGVTDPRLIGGAVNPDSAVSAYNAPITISSGETTVRARLLGPGNQWSGLVEATFIATGLAGDFDSNGLVDAADEAIWRATYGSNADLRADANGNGLVDAGDYTIWRDALAAAPPASQLEIASNSVQVANAATAMPVRSLEQGRSELSHAMKPSLPGSAAFTLSVAGVEENSGTGVTPDGESLATPETWDQALMLLFHQPAEDREDSILPEASLREAPERLQETLFYNSQSAEAN